jgi:hypothetical protein
MSLNAKRRFARAVLKNRQLEAGKPLVLQDFFLIFVLWVACVVALVLLGCLFEWVMGV